MTQIAVILNLAAAFGLAALGAKYAFGPVPAPHHARMLSDAGVGLTDTLTRILKVLYLAMGASFIALALGIAMMAISAVGAGELWAGFTILAMGVIAGVPLTEMTRRTELATGVRTPWRQGYVLTGLIVLAFVVSLF